MVTIQDCDLAHQINGWSVGGLWWREFRVFVFGIWRRVYLNLNILPPNHMCDVQRWAYGAHSFHKIGEMLERVPELYITLSIIREQIKFCVHEAFICDNPLPDKGSEDKGTSAGLPY